MVHILKHKVQLNMAKLLALAFLGGPKLQIMGISFDDPAFIFMDNGSSASAFLKDCS